MKVAAILLALAACGSNAGDGGGGNPPGPGPIESCDVTLFAPTSMPTAPDPRVTVHAMPSQATGTVAYTWAVQFNGQAIPTASQTADNSEIAFAAQNPGVYDVSVAVAPSVGSCPAASIEVNVGAANAQSFDYRFRVVPPPGVAMEPIDMVKTIPGGATYALGDLLGSGAVPSVLVTSGPDGNVPAFLRIFLEGADGEIDAFADASGSATAILPTGAFDVLVVPAVDGLAPREVFNLRGNVLRLDNNAIVGSVLDPSGQPLVGAQVLITANGVPSSQATTGDDGSFTAFSDAVTGETIVVAVFPPAGSGLPRLSATSTELTLLPPMTITYAPNLARRDLAGIVITRGGAPLAGARVTVVGDTGAGGTVGPGHKGDKPVVATGAAMIATQADDAGALPSTLVPSAALSAVIALGDRNDDFAVVALDTTASLPTSLNAPAPEAFQTAITLAGKPVAGAVVDFLPTGALAQAAAPPVEVIADGKGLVSARLAVGGHYDVRVHDPAGAGAVLELPDVESTTLPTALALAPAIQIRGVAVYTPVGATVAQPIAGATVQVLCSDCDGLDAVRPLAEGRTDLAGRFVLAIPDPNADLPAVAR